MKVRKQVIVSAENIEPIVIDVKGDESVSIQVDLPPKNVPGGGKASPMLHVNGLRWRDEEHFHLGWLEKKLSFSEEVNIKLTFSVKEPSILQKEEKYVAPEEECSFCYKKKSEVEILVEKDFMARICNECVELSQNIIEERRNET